MKDDLGTKKLREKIELLSLFLPRTSALQHEQGPAYLFEHVQDSHVMPWFELSMYHVGFLDSIAVSFGDAAFSNRTATHSNKGPLFQTTNAMMQLALSNSNRQEGNQTTYFGRDTTSN